MLNQRIQQLQQAIDEGLNSDKSKPLDKQGFKDNMVESLNDA
ncbi:hypothetical protein [Thalassolituus sp.]